MAGAKPAASCSLDHFSAAPPPAVEAIIDKVLKSYADDGVTLNRRAIMGDSKTHVISMARFEIWWEIRQLPTRWGKPYGLALIAFWFHRKCHTTVVSGIAMWEKTLAERAKAAA